MSDLCAAPRPIEPIRRPFVFEAHPPGSKSETNRAYVLAALASGVSHIRRPLRAEDPDLLLQALSACGCETQWSGESVSIRGVAGQPDGGMAVSLGDGGTPARFMLAVGALARQAIVVDGSARMRQRPVSEGVDILRKLGASVEYAEEELRLPVRVGARASPARGGKVGSSTRSAPRKSDCGVPALRGGAIEVGRTASSQFISAAMLTAPWMERGVDIFFSEPPTSPSYIELSVAALRRFGGEPTVLRDSLGRLVRISVPHGPLQAHDVAIEPDASSAIYFLAAAALVRGSRVLIPGLSRGTKQPDGALLGALVAMGAREVPSASGVCVLGDAPLRGVDIDASRFPDGALCLGAVAAAAKGPTRIRGLETLKHKESNRVAVLASELEKLGCRVTIGSASVEIDPSTAHGRPVTIEAHNDHRVAMSFAVLGLVRPGLTIDDPACVAKSYPGFWEEFDRMRAASASVAAS